MNLVPITGVIRSDSVGQLTSSVGIRLGRTTKPWLRISDRQIISYRDLIQWHESCLYAMIRFAGIVLLGWPIRPIITPYLSTMNLSRHLSHGQDSRQRLSRKWSILSGIRHSGRRWSIAFTPLHSGYCPVFCVTFSEFSLWREISIGITYTVHLSLLCYRFFRFSKSILVFERKDYPGFYSNERKADIWVKHQGEPCWFSWLQQPSRSRF